MWHHAAAGDNGPVGMRHKCPMVVKDVKLEQLMDIIPDDRPYDPDNHSGSRYKDKASHLTRTTRMALHLRLCISGG